MVGSMSDDVRTLSGHVKRSGSAASLPPRALRKASSRRWLIIAAAAVTLAGAISAWRVVHGAPPPSYVTASAAQGFVERTVTATGTLNPTLTVIVGSYVSGTIVSLSCDYNTLVKIGQVCAKIEPRPYQTAVDQAKANVAVAKAQLEKDKANRDYAETNNQRLQQLVKHGSISMDAADQAKNAFEQAQAQIGFDEATIEQRQAELEAQQVNLDYTNIVSPVDGMVISRNVTQGQTIASSLQTPTLFLVGADLTRMQVDTNVSESDIGDAKEGDAASFTVDAYGKRVFQGKVVQVRRSPQTVQNVVTYDAVVGVDNPDLALMPGMTAQTRIVVDWRDDVLRVPDQALRYAPAGVQEGGEHRSGPRVWVLRDGKPVAVSVTTGLDDETFTEIVGGELKAGDAVIVGEERGEPSTRAVPPVPRP
jgi:HlyD family secretion protein